MQNFQFHKKLLGKGTFAAGDFVINMSNLERTKGDFILHLVALEIQVICSAVTLSSGSLTPEQAHAIIKSLVWQDGTLQRFGGSLLTLRTFEEFEQGGRRRPEALTISSGGTTVVRRTLNVGPPMLWGSPTDFCIANAALKDATLTIGFDALANINANLTALTASVEVVARCIGLRGEARVPPPVERKTLPLGTGGTMLGECLVPFMFAGKNTLPYWTTAIAAGDIGNVTISDGKAPTVANVHASEIADGYNQAFSTHNSMGGGFIGEPRDANDTYLREINPGTPTAWQAQTSRVQPLLSMGPDARLSKCLTNPKAALQLDYTGSASQLIVGATRVLPQSAERIGVLAKVVSDAYGLKTRLKQKGSTKDPMLAPYMPYAVSTH
jgi:hypothetical protein